MRVDVPRGHVYFVQIDRLRSTDKKIQHDRSGELMIDEENPQRFTVLDVTMTADPSDPDRQDSSRTDAAGSCISESH